MQVLTDQCVVKTKGRKRERARKTSQAPIANDTKRKEGVDEAQHNTTQA